jgi:hypothetical protein
MTGRGQIFVYKLYTFFVGCNALVLPLQHFTFISNQIVLTTMKRMLNKMLRYVDAIVKRGVDRLIDAIAYSAEPQSENAETPQQQKRMGNDTDCGLTEQTITLMDEQCDISYNALDRMPEVQRRDQVDKGLVPVSKLVRNTMVVASFNGAECGEVRILWCSMRFAANAENIRTKGHKNKRVSSPCPYVLKYFCSYVLLSLCPPR